jgi:glycosyltransferase involved in cell wall biosynthesis
MIALGTDAYYGEVPALLVRAAKLIDVTCFDPVDADSVARAMAATMEDENLRSRLVEKSRGIVQQILSWEEFAARFVEVLERTARGELASPDQSGVRRPNGHPRIA